MCIRDRLWYWDILFGTWVYHHGGMFLVRLWSCYDVDLWPRGQIYWVYYMALCSGHSFFVLWHSHTMSGTWVYHHGTMCRVHSGPLLDLDVWPQYQNYISIMHLSRARPSLLLDIGIPNFGIWMYHLETRFWVHSWPLYDLDLWPTCGLLSLIHIWRCRRYAVCRSRGSPYH